MFPPDGMFAEVPAVVAPEYDDGVVGFSAGFQGLQNVSHEFVDVSDAGGVVAANLVRVFAILARVLVVVVVLAEEFARPVPSGSPVGFF